MPRKKAKKRGRADPSKGNKSSLYRIQHIHDCIRKTRHDAAGNVRCYNAQDIVRYLHHEAVPSVIVSATTVRRDIAFMQDDMNLPIEFDQKRNGFYYTKTVDKLPLIKANEGDLFGLLVFKQMLHHHEGSPMYKQLSHTMDKITAQLSEELSVSLGDLSKAVAHRSTKIPKIELERVRVISSAVTKHQQLSIRYKSARKGKAEDRIVDPYQCVLVNDTWYLYAFDYLRKKVIPFKAVRIEAATTTGKVFPKPDNFNVDDYLDWGVMRGEKEYDVVVDFIPEVADFLREKQFHRSQVISEKKDGSIRVSWRLSDYREFRAWVLTWGAAATVVMPKELRESMYNIGKKIAKHHK